MSILTPEVLNTLTSVGSVILLAIILIMILTKCDTSQGKRNKP